MTRPLPTRTPMSGVNPFLAGLLCRCPNCGEAPLFCGYLRVCPRCEACGEDLSNADSGDGPVVFILLIVGAIGCFGLLFTEFTFHPPVWLEIIIFLPLMGVMTLAALRPFKAILIAMQFHNRASEARNDDAPSH
jgi:uncharacterized protein (DUF983 family)